MTHTMTPEILERLAPYERYFKQAIEARYCSYPGETGIDTMLSAWKEATGEDRRIQRGCSRCLFNLVEDVAILYFCSKKPVSLTAPSEPEKSSAAKKKPTKSKKK